MLSIPVKNIRETAHHRNGISGEPFYVVRFVWQDGKTLRHMVALAFDTDADENERIAVLDADETAKGNIAFAMGNSWRGDEFASLVRYAIKEYDAALDAKYGSAAPQEGQP